MKQVYFTADIGLNTNGDLKRACNLIFEAKQCGFNAVKFQLYDADRLTEDPKTRELLKAGQFNPEWLPEIRGLCDDLELDLAITPFYPEAVDVIYPYVDWIKIGSYEFFYNDLLKKINRTNIEVIASTGMVKNYSELHQFYTKIKRSNIRAFLYCVPKYPCSPEDICFHELQEDAYPFPKFGWSDHSHNPNVIWASLMAGAQYIELHFDLEGCGLEYNQGHVWTAVECLELLGNIKSALKCFDPTTFVPDFSKQTNQEGRRRK